MSAMSSTVLVTGGASGIGLAIAQAIVAEGWTVVVADVDPGNLERARELVAAHQPTLGGARGDNQLVHFARLDVTDEAAVAEAIARCEDEIGPLTGLVNSAGIGADVPCLDTTAALFR